MKSCMENIRNSFKLTVATIPPLQNSIQKPLTDSSWKVAYKCVVWHCFWGDLNRCPLSTDRELTRDQSKDTNQVHLGEPKKQLTGIWVRATWQELGWLKGSHNTESPAHQHGDCLWQLEPWSSLWDFQAAQQVWVSLQAACLMWVSSAVLIASLALGRRSLAHLVGFRDLSPFRISWVSLNLGRNRYTKGDNGQMQIKTRRCKFMPTRIAEDKNTN